MEISPKHQHSRVVDKETMWLGNVRLSLDEAESTFKPAAALLQALGRRRTQSTQMDCYTGSISNTHVMALEMIWNAERSEYLDLACSTACYRRIM
jgi:hypothetical protein